VSLIGVGTCEIDANQAGNASYSPAPQVQQSFNIGPPTPGITSPNHTIIAAESYFSFTVTTYGTPMPSITEKGKLPKHVTFVNDGNGTATISGTPTKKGVKHLSIRATFGSGTNKYVVSQAFTLTVNPG
jgi:hypothetical protein